MVSIYADNYRLIIEQLVKARKAAGITQQELAEILDQRQTFISKYEPCERRLDVAEFIEISRAIGADPYALLRKAEKGFKG